MDLNTIREVKRPTSPDDLTDWRQGYAWLAGGTWLFSEPQLAVDTLIDLEALNWRSLEASSAGLELAATCRIGELERFEAPAAWTAAPLLRECSHALLMSFKIYNEATVGGNICMSLPAGAMISLTVALEAVYTLWPRGGAAAQGRGDRLRHRQPQQHPRARRAAALDPHPGGGAVEALRLPPRFAHPPRPLGGAC